MLTEIWPRHVFVGVIHVSELVFHHSLIFSGLQQWAEDRVSCSYLCRFTVITNKANEAYPHSCSVCMPCHAQIFRSMKRKIIFHCTSALNVSRCYITIHLWHHDFQHSFNHHVMHLCFILNFFYIFKWMIQLWGIGETGWVNVCYVHIGIFEVIILWSCVLWMRMWLNLCKIRY